MSKELLEKINTVLNKDEQLLNEEVIGFDPHNKISLSITEYLHSYVKDLCSYIIKELKIEVPEPRVFLDGSIVTSDDIHINIKGPYDLILHIGVSTDYPKIRGIVIHGTNVTTIDSQTPNAALIKIKSSIKNALKEA
jgi:hypothetical protein